MNSKFAFVTLISLLALSIGHLIPPKVAAASPTGFKAITVIGEIFCLSCQAPGFDTSFLGFRADTPPLPGAKVRVKCYIDQDGNYNYVDAQSGPCGSFSVAWPNVMTFDNCTISLTWSPSQLCSRPFFPIANGANSAPLNLLGEFNEMGIYSPPGVLIYGPQVGTPCPTLP